MTRFDYYEVAFDILLDIGAIAYCEYHDDYYYNTYKFDEENVYPIATIKIKASSNYGDNIDMKSFHSEIKKIMDESGVDKDNCPFCDDWFDKTNSC